MRAILLTLLASTAFASLVHFSPAALEQVLGRSEAVIVGERVHPENPDDMRFRVLETLRWSGTGEAPSGTLSVFDADRELNEAIGKHIQEHGYEGVPSPILPRYASTLDEARFRKTKRVILFLRRWKTDWQLAMYGGWEALREKPHVLSAIAALKK
ncbi:MAG TPA: hypothetical protein VFF06_02055 [Polyangia bacterium]|nr:hypothetical protein [Polyangia bacterium]